MFCCDAKFYHKSRRWHSSTVVEAQFPTGIIKHRCNAINVTVAVNHHFSCS
uniref:Uncharacterized protein n=1 Tax=Echinococcus granulosus TaxID=6210 RepID=A0A068WZL6_ECHGR|nr:hypothetical protein EgrG_000052800 [Echinococcus granulosus]